MKRTVAPSICIKLLASYVLGAHVHRAFHAKFGACCCGSYAVLASAGLGNETLFLYAFCQKYLAVLVRFRWVIAMRPAR